MVVVVVAAAGLFLPFCPALRQFSRMRIDPAWVSLAWCLMHRVEFCHGIRRDPVLLEQACGLVTGRAGLVVPWWVGGWHSPMCGTPRPCLLFLLSWLCLLGHGVGWVGGWGWGSPYFLSCGGWEGGDAILAAGWPLVGGWLACLRVGLWAWCLIIYVSCFFFFSLPPPSCLSILLYLDLSFPSSLPPACLAA